MSPDFFSLQLQEFLYVNMGAYMGEADLISQKVQNGFKYVVRRTSTKTVEESLWNSTWTISIRNLAKKKILNNTTCKWSTTYSVQINYESLSI